MSSYTPLDDIPKIRDELRAGFATGRSRDIKYRKEQLLHLAYMFQDNLGRWEDALKADLGRPTLEANLLELGPVIKEAMTAHNKVHKWAAPDSVPFDFNSYFMSPKVLKDPQGVVLIIGPFNYPLWCTIIPLIGAIAAGCGVALKPSELASNVADLLAELVPKYLDQDLYRIVTAEIPGTTKLLELQWDHIMYTGNGTVGKIVATAAAKHLTPVSLELGGKSPVIVDSTADLALTARRVLWGKSVNAGQTCVAPDYILVTDGRQDALVAAFQESYKSFFPEGTQTSDSFGRLIAERHFDRINGMLGKTHGKVILGGETNRETRFIAPTIVKDVTAEDSLMSQEIFGPVLPIIPVPNLQAAVDFVNKNDKPLQIHVFSTSSKNKDFVRNNTYSGMLSINDLILGAAVEGLPFGGTGPAGYGSHCDKAGFDAFTHKRGVIDVPGWIDWLLAFRFPPYNEKKLAALKKMTMPKIPYARPAGRKVVTPLLNGSK